MDGIIPETGMELLKRMQKYEIQKVKNSLLKLEKEREIKIRKEIEGLSTKPIDISLEDKDEFEEKEMMKTN